MYRFPPPHKLRIKIILANGQKTIRNKKKKKKDEIVKLKTNLKYFELYAPHFTLSYTY